MQTNTVARSVAHSATVAGQNILVTGGAGSFGQAFVRRCLDAGARRVVVFSRDEAKHAAMHAAFNDPRLRFLIGDVRDDTRLYYACRDVDVVVHAAALKRVEVCEAEPNEAVATNIIGTQNVAFACIERGVGRALFLSTDKAAHANTLYGMTKAAAERLWLRSGVYGAGITTPTRFSATRYGNVAQSRGSVIPMWKAQAPSGALSITDPRMTRFFMSMDAAVDLVMLALSDMRGGDLFIPKIGAANILDLAREVAPKAEYQTVGLRPGEKLHETLITEDEAPLTLDMGTHYIVEPPDRKWDEFPAGAPRVPEGFVYRSDTAGTLSGDELRRLAA